MLPQGVPGAALRLALAFLFCTWTVEELRADSASETASSVRSEADYAALLDREGAGAFARLRATPDRGAALTAYPQLVAAYRRSVDALYEAASPHASRFPAWYADRLLEIGLADLGEKDAEFLLAELESGDFDRVVHAYYLISHSRLSLTSATGSAAPSTLWTRMVAVARGDAENRFWISLALAESRLLPGESFDRMRTKVAEGAETVVERIGRNADFLGPRIHQVLGIDPPDPDVAHLRIRTARDAAEARVREHALRALGREAAYEKVGTELSEMESGEFRSHRFLALMEHELPFLLGIYGLPDDPDGLLESVRFLCRGRGANRMSLWNAADALGRLYDEKRADEPPPPEEPPLPDGPAILAMGDAALPWLLNALSDSGDPERVRHLFESGAIPEVVGARPPADPAALRTAVRDAYYSLGYPPELRPAFERAIEALGPEESAHGSAAQEMVRALTEGFDRVQTAAAFDLVFEDFRRASREGLIPRRDVEPGFLAAFTAAATRVLAAQAGGVQDARRRADEARREGQEAAAAIATAESGLAAANTRVRDANARAEREQQREQEAIAAYNDTVTRLNEAIDRANADRGADASARAEARALEKRLDAEIRAAEKEAREAGAAFEAAMNDAADGREAAGRAKQIAEESVQRENRAAVAEQEADTAAERARARFDELLRRLIAGLHFVGIAADPAALGDSRGGSAERVAAVALLIESGTPPDAGQRAALERARSAPDSTLSALAGLALTPPGR